MKKIIFTVLLSSVCAFSMAQVTDNEKALRTNSVSAEADSVSGWKFGGLTNLTFTNTKLYNWAAGGENSVAFNGVASLFANYKKGKSAWDNSLDFGYGIMRQGGKYFTDSKGTDWDRPFTKTDDKIEFVSKYGRLAFKNWYYAALVDFKTQMTDGKTYTFNDSIGYESTIISKAMAPGYLSGGIGMDYKPNNYFSAYISPITARFIFVTDQDLADAGAFGVEAAKYMQNAAGDADSLDASGNKYKMLTAGENIKKEFGGYVRIQYVRTEWNAEWMKNIGFTTKLNLFSNYLENPQNVDVDWETLITWKLLKFFTINFNTQLLYDDDTKTIEIDNNGNQIQHGPKVQFKEILGIGFNYSF
ncbi:MAG: DUF3078 domain-containing protein [Bacteroidales bacterium]|nr:DUF3078 domain-containing protein [Bacteroidales bacterium]